MKVTSLLVSPEMFIGESSSKMIFFKILQKQYYYIFDSSYFDLKLRYNKKRCLNIPVLAFIPSPPIVY